MKLTLRTEQFPQAVYHKYGQGYPIVLLHGFGEDNRIWEKQIDSLQAHFTVLVPDIPGSGESILPTEPMRMELIAQFVDAILQKEQVTSTILFGHSMGGYASLAFAEAFNHKLIGLGLVHSSAFEDSPEKKQTRAKSIKLIEQGGKEAFVKALIPNIYSAASKEKYQTEIQTHLTRFLEISSDALVAYYTAMMNRPDRTTILQQAPYPVFLFSGTEDTAVPFTQSLQQSHLAPHTHFEAINGIGHMGMVEASDLLNESMINYCNSILNPKMT